MENVVEALKMAGSVLLFVLSLSLSIFMITQSRETIDAVLKFSDRESLTIAGDERFYYLSDEGDTKRYVGKETIIPAIYRAYKENYKIVFIFHDNYYLFKQDVKETTVNGDGKIEVATVKDKEICTIDLANQTLGSDLASRQFLNGIIYGDYAYEEGKSKSDFEKKFKIKVNSKPLITYLDEHKDSKKIEESLGTYMSNDVLGTSQLTDVDKTEKRVITYEFKDK